MDLPIKADTSDYNNPNKHQRLIFFAIHEVPLTSSTEESDASLVMYNKVSS